MNKNIKKCWDQAAIDAPDQSWEGQVKFIETFAELIIREYSYDVMNLTAKPKHVEIAAKHWGVEL